MKKSTVTRTFAEIWRHWLQGLSSTTRLDRQNAPTMECPFSSSLDLELLQDRTLLTVGSTLVPVPPPIEYDSVLTFDIDRDGVAEVLAHVDRTGSWWLMSADGTVGSQDAIAAWPGEGQFDNIQLLNLDGDATPEIVGRSAVTGQWWSVSFSNGGAKTRQLASWKAAPEQEQILTGRLAASGHDAIVAYSAADHSFRTLTLQNNIAASFKTAAPAQLSNPTSFLVADTDGDGRDEVYARSEDGHWWRGVIGRAGLELEKVASWSTKHEFITIVVADIDGDGREEIVGRNTTGTWWGIFRDDARYSNRLLNIWSTRTTYETMMTMDIHGDGTESIVGRDSNSGRWWALVFVEGRWQNRSLTFWPTTSSFSDVQVVDFDGDGDEEIIGREVKTGTWWALDPSQNANVHLASWNPETPLSHIIASDLNGDSQVDFLGLATETGLFWSIQSTDAGYRHERLASWNLDWQDQSHQSTVIGADSDLKKLIARQVPGLVGEYAAQDLDAVSLLLDWAANATNFAMDGQTATETNYGIDRRSAADLYFRTFLPNTGGVYCGGMSVFTSKVFELFGFASFTVDFGQLRDSITHVSVIVSVPSGDTFEHYIFDPTFNGFFRKADGELATIDDLLSSAIGGDHLQFASRPLDLRDRVGVTNGIEPFHFAQRDTELYVYKWPTYSISEFLVTYTPYLVDGGYSNDPIVLGELMSRRIFSIEVNDHSAARNSAISVFQKHGIPIGYP